MVIHIDQSTIFIHISNAMTIGSVPLLDCNTHKPNQFLKEMIYWTFKCQDIGSVARVSYIQHHRRTMVESKLGAKICAIRIEYHKK